MTDKSFLKLANVVLRFGEGEGGYISGRGAPPTPLGATPRGRVVTHNKG